MTRLDPHVIKALKDGVVPDNLGLTAEYLSASHDAVCIRGILFIAAFTSAIAIARIISRSMIVRKTGVDDLLAAISFLIFIPYIVCVITAINTGAGRHVEYVWYVLDTAALLRCEILDFIVHILYTVALFMCRLSGLVFYFHICGYSSKFRIAIWILGVLLFASFMPQLMLLVFHCKPVTAAWFYSWQPGYTTHECMSWPMVYGVNAGVSLASDFVVFGIPIAMLWGLNVSRKKKVQLASILLPGVIVTLISITRLTLIFSTQNMDDYSWAYGPVLTIESAEVGATIIALSVPALKPLLRFITTGGKAKPWTSEGTTLASTADVKPSVQPSASRRRDSVFLDSDNEMDIAVNNSINTNDEGGQYENSNTEDTESTKGIFVNMSVGKRE